MPAIMCHGGFLARSLPDGLAPLERAKPRSKKIPTGSRHFPALAYEMFPVLPRAALCTATGQRGAGDLTQLLHPAPGADALPQRSPERYLPPR